MKLPVMDYETKIINTVAANPVTVIEAETGAGKSTQIPHMLHKAGLGRVTVTQPQVMAAISLANRLADEFSEKVGSDIGYKTRFYKTETRTPITYVTDGYFFLPMVKAILMMLSLSTKLMSSISLKKLFWDFTKKSSKLIPTLSWLS